MIRLASGAWAMHHCFAPSIGSAGKVLPTSANKLHVALFRSTACLAGQASLPTSKTIIPVTALCSEGQTLVVTVDGLGVRHVAHSFILPSMMLQKELRLRSREGRGPTYVVLNCRTEIHIRLDFRQGTGSE